MILLFAATIAFGADNSCLMSEQQQRNTILSEAPKALSSQPTSDCFQRLLKDETELLKRASSPLANDRKGIIEEMLQTASRAEDTKTATAE